MAWISTAPVHNKRLQDTKKKGTVRLYALHNKSINGKTPKKRTREDQGPEDLKTKQPEKILPSYAILHLRIYRVFASSTVHFATVGGPTSCAMVVHCDDLTWSFVDERTFDVKTWEAWTTLWIGAENGKELRLKCQELNGMLMYLAHSIWRLKTMSLADRMNH